jgi:hypothetical protein
MPVTTKTGVAFMRQTKRWRSQLFTSITDRALRPSVVLCKVTNGFRSLPALRCSGRDDEEE